MIFFLARLAGGTFSASMAVLIIYNAPSISYMMAHSIGDMVARYTTVVLLGFWSNLLFGGAVLDYVIIARPLDLTIDSDGIRFDAAGSRRSYQWREVGKVTIRHMSTWRLRRPFGLWRVICLHLLPGTPPPAPEKIMAWPFPKVEKKTGWVIFASLLPFEESQDKIQTALALFAGSRWDPPR